MLQRSISFRFNANICLTALLCLALAGVTPASAGYTAPAADMANGNMPGHMYMTTLKPLQPGDQQKADAVVAAAKTAMAPYEDYHKALADGYQIFLPNVPQTQYHFTKHEYGRDAWCASIRSSRPRFSTRRRRRGIQAGGRDVHRSGRRQ